jgi:hypothetical protein
MLLLGLCNVQMSSPISLKKMEINGLIAKIHACMVLYLLLINLNYPGSAKEE